ncbi:right-handed parallel beta-helix repeat-containing protein [Streptosporangium amethystogenes]|uniref:right-handed parallel beta-helix repeat-containing protein n=1 Tax=Streptosporangium amethystogenes TaxID=2002 RepID=UPI0004CBB431|nr:right-handed parallel beta-helix repeat-containing protein [Streptosporangium amethystogenes]
MSLVQAEGETFVKPGESIQRALDEAGPGATIRLAEGDYAESLWIKHSGVTLVGEGPELTRLVPGAVAKVGIPQLHDASEDVVSGISVHGDGIRDVTVRGLAVSGFSGSGVYAHTVQGLVVEDVEARDNDFWGVYVRECSGVEVLRCRASGSQYAGIALSFCPEANALVAENETSANAFGIFVDNSSKARMLRNTCHGNSAGLLLLNQTYEGELPGGVNDCLVAENELRGNGLLSGEGNPNGLGEAGPPISGVGLALIGAHRVTVVGNRIHDNHPSGPSVMGGAFVLGSSKDWGGDESLDNHISWNRITGNTPLDVQVDADFTRQGFAGNVANATAPDTIEGCAAEESR